MKSRSAWKRRTRFRETEPIERLRVLDQMRHFPWFYSQAMGDKLRSAKPSADARAKVKGPFLDRLSRADEIMLLHHLADAERRKPN